MIQLTKLTDKHIHILDDDDNEVMVDREHFEQWAFRRYEDKKMRHFYWGLYRVNDFYFRSDMRTYIAQHHDLDYISNIQNELT